MQIKPAQRNVSAMDTATRKRTTIQDIAGEAGVSISTVSRVLNGKVPVHKDKRSAVLRAVEKLEYRPNIFAQGLAGGQSMTIGLLTQQISSPFYDSILHGALSGLRGTGYSPLIADGHWQSEKERKAINTLLARQVDGLVLIGPTGEVEPLQELARRTPVVVIGRNIPDLLCINMDDFGGGYTATKHLIDLGHHQIAHIMGIPTHEDAVARCHGYRKALEDAGLPVDEALIAEGQFSEQSGVLAVEMLLTRGRSFSAIFAANDQMAYGARLALFRHRIRVPDDMSIVGYDDQATSAYIVPPLTTMRQPGGEIGRTAAAALLNLVKGNRRENVRFSAELIPRESTARFR